MKRVKLLNFFAIAAIGLAVVSCGKKVSPEQARLDSIKKDSITKDSIAKVESASANTLTDQEKTDGVVLLFDGKTTTGWRGYNKTWFPDTVWKVEEGTLHCMGSGRGEAGAKKGGDIMIDKKFKNFEFSLEWKVQEGGNSGIFYMAQEIPGKAIWHTALEMQVLDPKHKDAALGKDGNRQAGSLYDLIPAKPQNMKPGDWNKAKITVYKGTVIHEQNGEKVLEYHLWTEEWKALVAGSKFPKFNPTYAEVAEEGIIGLQDHGDDVWYRNIKIKELK